MKGCFESLKSRIYQLSHAGAAISCAVHAWSLQESFWYPDRTSCCFRKLGAVEFAEGSFGGYIWRPCILGCLPCHRHAWIACITPSFQCTNWLVEHLRSLPPSSCSLTNRLGCSPAGVDRERIKQCAKIRKGLCKAQAKRKYSRPDPSLQDLDEPLVDPVPGHEDHAVFV